MLLPQITRSQPGQAGTGRAVAQRLAARGFGADCRDRAGAQEIVILNVPGARSCLTITEGGCARWHYEPRTGPATDPGALAAITLHILGAPVPAARPGSYQAFTLKGAAGRQLQDHGLTVALRVYEDLESLEAAAEIEVTSLARPARGSVTLNDDGDLDWACDLRAAFGAVPARLIDIIAPVLR